MIFAHSSVPALNQLMLPFLSLVTDAELHRNPTVKAESLASRRSLSALLLTYPVHQAADILGLRGMSCRSGKDQLPHIELDQGDRPPVQRPVRVGLRRAGGAADVNAGGAGRRRREDVEDPRQHHPARRHRGRDGGDDPCGRGRMRCGTSPSTRSAGRRCPICCRSSARSPDVDPVLIAEEIGDGGALGLKALASEVINESLRGLRRRRRRTVGGPRLSGRCAARRHGAAPRRSPADTLDRVRQAMGMDYLVRPGRSCLELTAGSS